MPARRLVDAPESSGLIVAYDLDYIGDEELSYLESPPEVRATRVREAAAEPEALDDLVALDRLGRAAAALTGDRAAGVLRTHGRRRAQFCGGPVKTNQL